MAHTSTCNERGTDTSRCSVLTRLNTPLITFIYPFLLTTWSAVLVLSLVLVVAGVGDAAEAAHALVSEEVRARDHAAEESSGYSNDNNFISYVSDIFHAGCQTVLQCSNMTHK